MLTLKDPAPIEIVVCIDGPMKEENPVQARAFFRGTDETVELSLLPKDFAYMIDKIVKPQPVHRKGATFLIRSDGGDAGVAWTYEHLIDTLGSENVQGFSLQASSGAANTLLRTGHPFTTPNAWIGLHAARHRETGKVSLDNRRKYVGWWVDFLKDAERRAPELVARIQREIFKDNWDDEMEQLPVLLTGAEMEELGKVEIFPNAAIMEAYVNGFLPEAAQDPMVRGFWTRATR